MIAHIVVPTYGDEPATISPRIMTGLLRDELGFEGVAITDGLEMGALSSGRSIGEGAALALAAGCDGLLVGGGRSGEDVVDELAGSIAGAGISEERLTQAANRLAKVSRPIGASRHFPASGEDAAHQAARQAIRADGDVHVGREAVVIQLASPSTIAAGDIPWGMAEALKGRGVQITPDRGRVVIVVRDLHRQPENQAEVARLLARHPDAVLVEMGLPLCRPQGARAYVATNGSGRVCAEAAAERMTRP